MSKEEETWQEMKATVQVKAVWLLSLFFFSYLGTAITAGGEYDQTRSFFVPYTTASSLRISVGAY